MEQYTEVIKAEAYDVVSDKTIPFDKLKGSSVLVTGADGLIGGAVIRVLNYINKVHEELNLDIIPYTRATHGDIRDAVSFKNVDSADYIFHCASMTKSADMVSKPADVMLVSLDGTKNVLELARRVKSKSVVYLSSMEVYGQAEGDVTEKELGCLDLSSPRSSYPESKRACEVLCVAYHTQHDVPVKISRLAQTFGGGVPKTDTRVFAQFTRSAVEETDIILHTVGKSVGNYCYISDVVRGLFVLLLKGTDGQAYNIANNSATMTIREMAEVVANEVCNGKIKVRVEVPKDVEKLGYAPQTGYQMNIDKIRVLGWQPRYGLDEMYRRMLKDWELRKREGV